MNTNLQSDGVFKDLLLKKLSCAVSCSVFSNLAVVFIYIAVMNFDTNPSLWFSSILTMLTSLSTWLYLVPFCSIIFTQITICAKDYVFKTACPLSRFEKLMSVLSIRTFILCFLHILIGGLVVWMYLSLSGGRYQTFYTDCEDDKYCLKNEVFVLILGGLWTGLYFFLQVYMTDRNIIFPVVQQSKLLYFKAQFLLLLEKSRQMAFYPTLYFSGLYYFYGLELQNLSEHIFQIHIKVEDFNYELCIYIWIFTALYFLNMNLMRFFFELFLTESVEHPVMFTDENNASLAEALLIDSIPILQHLACLDLYLLSIWSPERRQMLFTLSQPGGHPYTWNNLVQGILKLLIEFIEGLNVSMDALTASEEKSPQKHEFKPNIVEILPPTPPETSQKYHNMRNMSLISVTEPVEIVEVDARNMIMSSLLDIITEIITKKIMAIFEKFKNISIVKYIFGQLPEAQISEYLRNGQLIVWLTQAVANIVVSSLTEDPYGIIQKDLPALLTSLVQLRQTSEKLSKISTINKKDLSIDDFSVNMNNSVNSAVKRSLLYICRAFANYLTEIPLERDVAAHLQTYL